MVKRYQPNWNAGTNSHGVHDAVDGEFVRHSDYAALEAQLAELAAENERLKRVNNGLHNEVQFMRQAAKEAREALSRTGAVKVKTLEWTKLSTGWIAHTPFHAYEIVATDRGFMATYANLDFAWGEEETMKLAAQADYERRILSALEPAATEGQQEAVGANPVECATEGCASEASTHFVRGGVGSYYCAACYLKVQAIPHNSAALTRPSEQAVTERKDPAAIRAHATRVLERMNRTPYGPKRKLLATQHVDLTNEALRAEGWNEALTAAQEAGKP